MAAEKRGNVDSQCCTFPPLHVGPRSFPRHWLPQDSVNYCQCVNCRDRPKRHAGRDEIGGNRRAGGFLSVGKLAFLRAAAVPALLSLCPSSRCRRRQSTILWISAEALDDSFSTAWFLGH